MRSATSLKTSFYSYLVLFACFSLPIVILPILMGLDKYLDSNYVIAHVPLSLAMGLWFVYLYQEVALLNDRIEIKVIRLFGVKTVKVKYSQITSWTDLNPIKLNKSDGSAVSILWTMYTRKDRDYLVKALNNKLGKAIS